MSTTVFDPEKFNESTRQQWQNAAKAWNDWGVFLRQWLGPATEQMLDMAGVVDSSRVLDVAADAGDQTMLIAEAVCEIEKWKPDHILYGDTVGSKFVD
jgi:hypothetical protein